LELEATASRKIFVGCVLSNPEFAMVGLWEMADGTTHFRAVFLPNFKCPFQPQTRGGRSD
jgi:hypothetical protein